MNSNFENRFFRDIKITHWPLPSVRKPSETLSTLQRGKSWVTPSVDRLMASHRDKESSSTDLWHCDLNKFHIYNHALDVPQRECPFLCMVTQIFDQDGRRKKNFLKLANPVEPVFGLFPLEFFKAAKLLIHKNSQSLQRLGDWHFQFTELTITPGVAIEIEFNCVPMCPGLVCHIYLKYFLCIKLEKWKKKAKVNNKVARMCVKSAKGSCSGPSVFWSSMILAESSSEMLWLLLFLFNQTRYYCGNILIEQKSEASCSLRHSRLVDFRVFSRVIRLSVQTGAVDLFLRCIPRAAKANKLSSW